MIMFASLFWVNYLFPMCFVHGNEHLQQNIFNDTVYPHCGNYGKIFRKFITACLRFTVSTQETFKFGQDTNLTKLLHKTCVK